MGLALLLLSLLPLAILPEIMGDSDDDEPQPDDIADASGDDLLSDDAGSNNSDAQTDDVLSPVDENDAPGNGTQVVDPETVLAPVIEDDVLTPSDGNEGDVLKPVDEIQSDEDTIWVNFGDDAGLGYSEISDFQTGQDVLHVLIAPEDVIGDLSVNVTPSHGGADSLVYVEQQLVAILKGTPDASASDVIVEIGGIAA